MSMDDIIAAEIWAAHHPAKGKTCKEQLATRTRELHRAIVLLRDLTDLQNGPPLETYRDAWECTMAQVSQFLETHEIQDQT